MREAYFDCFSGASGDMIVAALIDAGLPVETLRDELAKLGLPGFRIETTRVTRAGIAGTKFDVIDETAGEIHPHEHGGEHGLRHGHGHGHHHGLGHDQEHVELPPHEHGPRNLPDILALISGSSLSARVKGDSERIFRRLAEAEARVHGTGIDEVHFHEVGAVDSIVDIVGAAVGFDKLGIERIESSPLPTGGGFVDTAHGRLPVPAPATAELLKGFPIAPSEVEMELTTPTGAGVLTTLATRFGPIPVMTISSVGYGAGGRDLPGRPNLLRVLVGETETKVEADRVWVLETNIDDMPAELFETVFEKLFEAGARDVFATPIQMKKGRPGVMLSTIVDEALRRKAEDIILRETTTFGVRAYAVERRVLERKSITVKTELGEVRVKLGFLGGELLTASPEYEDCKRLAAEHGRPLKEVYELAKMASRQISG